MLWGYWKDYPKVRIGDKDYAKIGNRLYTEHAVERFQPSGRRTIGKFPVASREGGGSLNAKGRSISPTFIEDVSVRGSTRIEHVDGVLRTVHTLGDLEVVTEDNGHIVVTAKYQHQS